MAGTTRISGDTIAQQQPISIHRDDAGETTTVPYESTDFTKIYGLLPGLGVPYDYTDSFGKARLDIHYPYDFVNSTPQTQVTDLWEFFANKTDKDVLSADLPFGTLGPITPGDSQLIKVALSLQEQQIPIDEGWFTIPLGAAGGPLLDGSGNPVAGADDASSAYSYFLIMARGLKDYPVFAPVLRHTQTVTSLYAIQASFVNVRRLLSRGTLIVSENIPAGLLFNIPFDPTVTQFIQDPPAGAFGGDLQYGWFKDFPTVRQIARLKWNIVQEWQYGLWPIYIYGGVL